MLTFTFANSFLSLTTMRSLERPLRYTWMVQASLILALRSVWCWRRRDLAEQGNGALHVLLAARSAFALLSRSGAARRVDVVDLSQPDAHRVRTWRKDNPGKSLPLLAFVSVVTFLMWDLASLGVAVEVLVFLLPWSLGLTTVIDPLLNRTLFWFTGHPIVYFWLLPAYVSWYMMIPKQVGGRLYSDGVVRGVFILFLLLSTPVGLHHQFTDPGVDEGLKLVHGVFTFGVFFPSMVTAFTLVAAMESGESQSRRQGATRLDPEAAVGQSQLRCASAGDDGVRSRRRIRPDQCERRP